MAETLGSLCDKLTIVKLKEWHSEKQPERMRSLATQEQQLREEIDAFIADAASSRAVAIQGHQTLNPCT